ncbi:MAG: hypothetical protein RMJ07_04910 [Nitrososphaerota archaeon]|nr:hypothetical protein [Candidatus Bathyarchaeota archaeon]MDW8049006.1 hypothetical protein [Nitrososphaerota archaeon]
MAEFLILTPHIGGDPKRERVIMEAVIEAAEVSGISRIVKRRGNVYSIGVYLCHESGKSLLYNDWGREWDKESIFNLIISSLRLSRSARPIDQLVLSVS